jgi:acyl-coenzyme A synthetase/AMP-(fatty) acid ligase
MDDEGLLYFEGRTDDIIKTKGEKVSPLEVENVLQAIPGIREAAVIGVQNKTFGQTVQAFIVTDETMTLKERQLKMICLAKMENYMVPQSITFLTEMPKNQNGKIDKKKLPHQETA